MIISESWLREWVPTRIDSEELMHKLTLLGLEVGSVEKAGRSLDGVVVGEIIDISAHPDADRLRVCKVEAGFKQELNIVCGAANAAKGLKVAVATVGSELPGGLKISRSKIRGVESHGMLCSAAELELAEDSSGILELDSKAENGARFNEYFDLDDNIIEIDLTPNRGDCMSLAGIARELATATRTKLREPKLKPVKATQSRKVAVKLKSPASCPRFVGRIISGIDQRSSTPAWMVERLRRCGIRSISPVVDITNYVMIEFGQPMHAFDFDKLEGDVIVRNASSKEKLKLLDNTDVVLGPEHLVIADQKKAIALAGIMGGDATAISDGTTTILLEAAHFAPQAIIGRGRKLGLHTDAAQRFERGVDPFIQKKAMQRATELLLQIVGGEPGPIVEQLDRSALPKKKSTRLRRSRLEKMIGRGYPDKRVADVLTRLGMKVAENANGWRVTPPSWRFDVSHEHDLVEEVARVVGYDSVEPVMPRVTATELVRDERIIGRERIDHCLMTRDYREAVTYSFVDPKIQNALFPGVKPITLANPIASNMSDMRVSMLPGLIQALMGNLSRQHRRVRLYEVGVVFGGTLKKRVEKNRIAAVVTGDALSQHWSASPRPVDYFDIKGDLESILNLVSRDSDDKAESEFRFEATQDSDTSFHPGQSADIYRANRKVGVVGCLHPSVQQQLGLEQSVFVFEIDFEEVSVAKIPQFVPISRYPATRRDISVLVDETTPVGDVRSVIEDSVGRLLVNLEIFDIYRGESIESTRKSLSFGLTLQDSSRTLVEAEVDEIVGKVLSALETKVSATLRV